MLEFDAETSATLERAYQGRDFVRRRHANIAALAPRPNEHILDVGCGNGLMLTELSGAVGPGGHVTGIDLSDDMLRSARRRCGATPNVSILKSNADALPFEDDIFHGVISVQVFEYFPELGPVLNECHRVLKPGGRLVVGDMHFDTLAWYSAHPNRMEKMLRIWDGHFVDRAVPSHLLRILRDHGFTHRESRAVTFVDTECRQDGLARMMLLLMAAYAHQTGAMADEDIEGWLSEQEDLARSGSFFFAMSHIVTMAEAA